jgi:hydroxyacylglutathione hydrolase
MIMFFRHVYEKGLAHASYVVGCQASGTAMVIDPQRDIDVYLDIASQEKLRITHILETHIHADFLSGSRELASVTGAKLYLSDEGGPEWQYAFPHEGIKDGDSFMVGNLRIDVLHTPGHTPEHISFLLTDTPSGNHPVMMFTGDFVFVGDVGRPDLLEKAAGYSGTMVEGAKTMFNSLKRFKLLPDHIQIWPAHGAGSACGKALGAVPGSTVGYEKLVNWALKHTDEDAFVKELLEGQPEPPYYFAMMKSLNKIDRPLLSDIPALHRLGPDAFLEHIKQETLIIDTRPKQLYAETHIPGSVNIQNNKAFSTWMGWIVEYDKPFILIAQDQEIESITRKMMRIGMDHCKGFITDIQEYVDLGYTIRSVHQMTLDEVHEHMKDSEYTILDVRSANEFADGHIPGAINIHGGQLRNRLAELPEGSLIVHCQGGDRSSIAMGILEQANSRTLYNVPGGFNEWKQHNFEIEA